MHRFAVFVACATFCLIVAGALVTSNEAGLAVPDWPLSYGSLTPPWVGNIRYEHGHRVVAATVGFLTIVLAVWLGRKEPRRWVRRLGYCALGTVIVQGLLGGITVLFFLPIPVSAAHACLAQAFFCMTVTLALATGRRWQQPVLRLPDPLFPSLGQLATLSTVSVYSQLILGAALRHKGFGILPHLVGAAVVAALVMWTLYGTITRHGDQPLLLRPAGILAGLLFIQLILGAASYMVREATRDAPQPLFVMVVITVAHVATGALTLAASLWLTLESRRLLAPLLLSRDRPGAVPA
jgi:cytochrome c oxidase assembly protein subunit 15